MLITNKIQKSKAGEARRVLKHLTVMTVVFCLFVMACLLVMSRQALHSMLGPVSSQIMGAQTTSKDREIVEGNESAVD
jgi:Na+-driven multidrug efflux pump